MAKSNVSLGGRDILDLESLSVEEIELILKTAEEMKKIMKRDIKRFPLCVVNPSSICSMNPVPVLVLPLNWQANIWVPM